MRPYIIEFTGTPEAGKTTSIMKIISILKSHGFNVGHIKESAEILPNCIPKRSWHAHIWMRCTTIAELIEMTYRSQYDVVICDRGALDALFFGYKFMYEERCSFHQLNTYIDFIKEAKVEPDFLITLYTTPEEAIRRRGGEGTLVTEKWLTDYNNLLHSFYSEQAIDKIWLDTTNQTADQVKDYLVNIIEKKTKDYQNGQ